MDRRKLLFIIGANINKCIEESGITVNKYAKHIGVTRHTAYNYIDGITGIDCYTLFATAEKFQKPIEWFFEEDHNHAGFSRKQKAWIRNEIEEILREKRI